MSIVVALDPPPNVDAYEWISNRYEQLKDIVEGFKIGLPAFIRLGAERIGSIFKNYEGLLIADLKLADIGDVMALSIEVLRSSGFNAVIAHSFVGVEQALDTVAYICKKLGVKLILVVSMSHKGSTEFIDRHLDEFVGIARNIGGWGIVAPATRPQIIRYIRSDFRNRDLKILSPGVGVQGAEPGSALCNGADYEIIGRAITIDKPRERALKIREEQINRLRQCRT